MLILKIILKIKKKYILFLYISHKKNILKSNRYYIFKHYLNIW
jgi:hypothetical protein